LSANVTGSLLPSHGGIVEEAAQHGAGFGGGNIGEVLHDQQDGVEHLVVVVETCPQFTAGYRE